MRIIRGERMLQALNESKLTLLDVTPVHLGVPDDAVGLTEARDSRRLFRRVSHQAAARPVLIACKHHRREMGDPAIVRKGPEDRVEVGSVGDGAGVGRLDRGGQGFAVGARRFGKPQRRERAAGDDQHLAASFQVVHHAQALAWLIVHTGDAARRDGQRLGWPEQGTQPRGDDPRVEECISLRQDVIVRERHGHTRCQAGWAGSPAVLQVTTSRTGPLPPMEKTSTLVLASPD